MYADLINGNIVKAPNIIRGEEFTVINPTDEQYEEYGYKLVVETPQPEYEEGYYYTSKWVEEEKEIVKVWEKHEQEIVEPVEYPKSTNEIVSDILMGRGE